MPAERLRFRSSACCHTGFRLNSIFIAAASVALLLICPSLSTAYPGEDQVLFRKALEKYRAGEYQEAEELYRRAAEATDSHGPAAQLNTGVAAFKSGKVEEAEKAFRTVFDPENTLLNAAAGYNLGVIEHKKAAPALETARKAPSSPEGVPQEELEKLKKELQEGVEHLEKALTSYRSAILKAPADMEMKTNYELGVRDLDLLKKKLEQLIPPRQKESDQNQEQDQQDQQQNQQNQQQNQQNQQNQQQNQQNQQQNQQNQQNQQQQDEQKQDQQPQEQDKKSEDEKDGQDPRDQQDKSGDKDEKKQDPQDEGKQDEKKDRDKSKEQKSQKQKQSEGGQKGEEGSSSGQAEPEPSPGEMSERDVERLLNALPAENSDALQKMLNVRTAPERDMEKDW